MSMTGYCYLWMCSRSWQFSLKFLHLQIEPGREHLGYLQIHPYIFRFCECQEKCLELNCLYIELPWKDAASDGAEVDQGDKEHQKELPRGLLELHLVVIELFQYRTVL